MTQGPPQIISTWISRRPDPWGFAISGATIFFLTLASLFFWNWPPFSGMPASGEAVFQQHSWWKAWSALAAHADEKHLLSNSLLFFIFGSFLAGYFGLFVFPLMAFAWGGITNLIVLYGMSPQTQLLGASGIVFWMGGAWLTLYFFLDVKRNYVQRILRAFGVGLLLFFPGDAFNPQISYMSHLIGFLLGVTFGFAYYFWNRRKFLASVVRIPAEPEDESRENEITTLSTPSSADWKMES